jgi:hypothetical protein
MMKHKSMMPEDCKCGGETQRCAVCDFGLFICKVCRGAEAALTTECCGRPMTEEERELTARGDLDFDMGVWFKDGQPVMDGRKPFR